MRRRQLIEIEDQPWCPDSIRDGATDYLQFVLDVGQPYRSIASHLGAALARANATRVVDLCSGGGGPWARLLADVRAASGGKPQTVRLTDLYPNHDAARRARDRSGGAVTFEPRPIDATRVDPNLEGFLTLFTSLHHFAPPDAERILGAAVERKEGVGVFEVTERRAGALLAMVFVPLLILLITPALRPFRWSRLFWTYVLPAIPLVGLVDGVISCLRSYTVEELRGMTVQFDGYDWEVGQERAGRLPLRVTWLIGLPRA